MASVGTYHHPFDRFVDWLEPWTGERGAQVVFQHGSTRPIEGATNLTMMAPDELLEHYRRADVVVLQGGAGGVMDARRAGRIPIVVPRVPVGHEVVDGPPGGAGAPSGRDGPGPRRRDA
uniref:CAZy families GT1 protein n=1 Tax=uncultured Rothia sp. TaxID=316088 RepID=A0A060C0K4_9MICC|nr:CAZy families GT1 protein [uncultured Rothia sp.]